ncbi:MAG: hypothetical protein H0W65_02800 [Sphingomonas sp.]|nr:hypothetical protein [Sphingomonas sp.]
MFQSITGCVGVLMFRNEERCTVLTLWRSEQDVAALDKSSIYRAIVDQILARGFLRGSQSTEVGHLHLTWIDQNPGDAGLAHD